MSQGGWVEGEKGERDDREGKGRKTSSENVAPDLSFDPTDCPWVSEDGRKRAFRIFSLLIVHHIPIIFLLLRFFFGITSVRFCGGESSLGIGDWLRNEKLGLVVAAGFA